MISISVGEIVVYQEGNMRVVGRVLKFNKKERKVFIEPHMLEPGQAQMSPNRICFSSGWVERDRIIKKLERRKLELNQPGGEKC